MLNDVKIEYGQGGLGRVANGEDHLSGLLLFTDAAPSGFSFGSSKQITSLKQAETLGIVADYSDETKATVPYVVETTGATGDKAVLTFTEPDGTIVTLCEYTVKSTETTSALQAAGIAAAINANTRVHGYTAAYTSGTFGTISARPGLGIFPNGKDITYTKTGTIVVDSDGDHWAGGVASELAMWHYHISEYFRLNPAGNLRVLFSTITANPFDFSEIRSIQSDATGKLRQVAVYLANTGSFVDEGDIPTAVNAIQTQCDTLQDLHQPLSVIVGTDIAVVTDLTVLEDLAANCTAKNVSVTIGQDGAALGAALFAAAGYSTTNVGAILGAVSAAKVNEDIAWVRKFNMTNGVELATPAFANGQPVDMVGDANLLDQLNNYRYIFLRTFVGVAGVYVNDNHTAIDETSDYAYINDNRTIDKANRSLYAAIVPELAGTLLLNSDGTLATTTLHTYKGLGDAALESMARNGEISAGEVSIDATQNVLQSNTLELVADVVPTGVARHIKIKLGFTTAIA